MSFEFVETLEDARRILSEIADARSIALDLEAAGFHRYSDRVCLIQISTPEGRDLILDPLAMELGDLLRPFLEDPDREILMHGSDYDLRLLDRDLDIHLTALFDTQAAAQVLGEPGLGLAALLEKFMDIKLAKKFQRADWAKRPLPEDMLEYAACDTRYLHELVAKLRVKLDDAGRAHWADEEFRALETIRSEEDADADPVIRAKKGRDLAPREVARLREAVQWRDEIARTLDRAPFRVAADDVLIDASVSPPRSAGEFASRKGMNGRLAHAEGDDLIERIRRIDQLPDSEVVGWPKPKRDGRGRPPPEIEEVADRLKGVRNRTADELGLDRGTLLPNAVVVETAFVHPRSIQELGEVSGIKSWQIEAVGERLLAALAGKSG